MQLLGRLIQGMDQRVAGDLENPGKRLIQFQDQKNGARNSYGRNDEGKDNSRIAWCENTEPQENNNEPVENPVSTETGGEDQAVTKDIPESAPSSEGTTTTDPIINKDHEEVDKW